MSKVKRLKDSYFIEVNEVRKNGQKPIYQVVTKDHEINAFKSTKEYDEINFTEEQWGDLEEYFKSRRGGIIWRPFSQQEIDEAWQPRFSGMNPKYIEFARMAWNAAFEYVNDQILKNRIQEETK